MPRRDGGGGTKLTVLCPSAHPNGDDRQHSASNFEWYGVCLGHLHMGIPTIEAAISFPEGEMRRTLSIEETGGFGLLERVGDGWTLCIPYGARAICEGVSVDLDSLKLDPSWERRLPYAFGGTAQIEMDGLRFEIRAS